MNFTNDERNLLCIYNAGTKKGTLDELMSMRQYLDPEEIELLSLTDSVMAKLNAISDEEFDALDLIPDFDPEDEDAE